MYKSWRPKGLFQFEMFTNVLASFFWSIWIPRLCDGSTTTRNIFTLTVQGSILRAESDVYRRQILTTKVDDFKS